MTTNKDKRLYFDSETCGLHGHAVLFQYAVEEGPITLYEPWKRPIGETLDLIEWMLTHTMVCFNTVFDHFMLCKMYTLFRLFPRDWIPEEHIDELAMKEPEAQDGPCLKPANTLDLLLHARKGPYQSLMAREDVRIRKVPTVLAYALADELEKRIELDAIYFAKTADKNAPRWHVFDRMKDGEIDTEFKDVVLRFNSASGLKYLAEFALGMKPEFHFKDVELDTCYRPYELGYAPTALAVASPHDGWRVVAGKTEKGEDIIKYAWPAMIKYHIEHWHSNADARKYAELDIVYTRALDKFFGYPTPGDNDSVLAAMVAAVRWHGFVIDIEGIKQLKAKAQAVVDASPVNINKPKEVRAYMYQVMNETERMALSESTKKAKLEAIRDNPTWIIAEREPCEMENCGPDCQCCKGTGFLEPGPHPAQVRVKEILGVKSAAKEVELYNKLLKARKFHASFNVIGTLSTRMSGGDGLNAQGIKRAKEVRRMFPLAWEGMVLGVGDFASFEVTLADAVYNDANLRRDLLTMGPCPDCAGKGVTKKGEVCSDCEGTGMCFQKIHALFAMELFPGNSYIDIIMTKDTENDLYTKGKQGVFALIYGGDWNTLVQKLNVNPEVAKKAFANFEARYPGVKKARDKTFKSFCSMKQLPNQQVVWADPADYAETFLGFRRYFTLENKIAKALFQMAQKPPKGWRNHAVKVVRRMKVQTAGGAAASALYGAAFGMQAANMRAAANHEIQSPGAQITKHVQRHVWDLQPAGVHEFRVALANIHDEILAVTKPEYKDAVADIIAEQVLSFRPKVPLIGMDWCKKAQSWADKGHGEEVVKIKPPVAA